MTSSSDTGQLLPLSGTNTLAEFCANEPQTDGFLSCQCGKAMSDCSIHPNTREEWIASQRDSLALILASLESRPDLGKALAVGFTEKSCELLASLSPDTSSWKMCRQLSILDLEQSLQTFPRWGMTADGLLYAHPMSALRIGAIDGLPSQFATPNTMDSLPPKSPEALEREATIARPGRSKPANLRDQVSNMQMWPTPRAFMHKDSTIDRGKGNLGEVVGGKLNVQFVEWLMGVPINYTKLKNSVVVDCQILARHYGYCPTHATRFRKYGDPMAKKIKTKAGWILAGGK